MAEPVRGRRRGARVEPCQGLGDAADQAQGFGRWQGAGTEGEGFEVFALDEPLPDRRAASGYVGAAATKSFVIGLIILATSFLFVPVQIAHPFWMLGFLLLTCLSFSLLGFIIGIWARNFEQLNLVPSLIITPLVFLGGSFYSISMLPPFWQTATLFNPIVYLVSGFRWSFFDTADVAVSYSLAAIFVFSVLVRVRARPFDC